MIVAIIATQWSHLPVWMARSIVPVLLLNAAAIGGAWLISQVAGLNAPDRLTVMIEMGLKNTTIGLMVSLSLIKNVELAIPSVIYGLMMYASAFVMARWGRKNLVQVAAC